jgi:hypothetical protein
MRPDLEWSYRTPPVQPLWKRLWEGFEPIGELILAIGSMAAVYYLAVLVTAL